MTADVPRVEPPKDGRCCGCGYDGEEETECPDREDRTHCEHWYEGTARVTTDVRNRPDSLKATDDWLTDPGLVEACGKFDVDPACHDPMPWRTAAVMYTPSMDGLTLPWKGRAWLNPPYSDILPWAKRLAEHGNGLLLVPAKSTDTRWAQLVLLEADAVLFFKGRLLFRYPDGSPSTGKWSPSMLAAFGKANVRALQRAKAWHPQGGIIMSKLSP